MSLGQFLATSLTFVKLQTLELWLDDWNILTLTKKVSPSIPISISKELETKTHDGILKVVGINRETVQIDGKWLKVFGWKPSQTPTSWPSSTTGGTESLRGFFSRLTATPSTVNNTSSKSSREIASVRKSDSEDLASSKSATIFLHITTADVRSSVTSAFSKELERATKKVPPQNTTIAILTSLHDQPSTPAAVDSIDLFGTVLPKRSGKVFIGFPTAQTTGLLAHVSAQSVIPTVERESIDLNARYVRTWNIELLRAAGVVCRAAWICEINAIKEKLWKRAPNGSITKEAITALLPEAVHLFRQFTFQESTPSAQVSQLLEEAFWTSGKKASIEVFSSQGVLPSHQVRLATEDLSGFVNGLAVVPEELVDGAKAFIGRLKEYGLLTDISITDVRKELENKTLDEKQFREFLEWCGRKRIQDAVSTEALRSMLDVAVVSLEDRLILVTDIKFFINPSRIPADLPCPPNTAPFSSTRYLSKAILESLEWEELQIVPWLRYLVENSGREAAFPETKDITNCGSFSGQVLPVVSKAWDSLSPSSKSTVVGLLQDRTIIPTRVGMRKPADAYFPSVKLFQDLPVVNGLNNVREKFLQALGVRKTVELSVIFDRLLAQEQAVDGRSQTSLGKWSHVDLIRYLASVSNDIPSDDIQRLKNAPICPAEDGQDAGKPTARRYKITDLFEPKDTLGSLGLPLLQWPGVYRPGSAEGRFLTHLGLNAHPSALSLIDIMAGAAADGNTELYQRALTYFIANHHINGYAKLTNIGIIPRAFLPIEGSDSKLLAAPADCFSNERSAVLGFRILRGDLHPHAQKFGVRADPLITDCVNRLLKAPPRTKRDARLKFGYLGSRLGEISQQSFELLGSSPIVPIFTEKEFSILSDGKGAQVSLSLPPTLCFLGDSSTYGDIFDFVDFGSEANALLIACGSKHTPTEKEVAALIVREPARVLGVFQSPEKYLSLLRSLAANGAKLKQDRNLFKQLKRASCLLAYKEVPANASKSTIGNRRDVDDELLEIDEEDAGVKEWSLANAGQVVLIDDYISYSLFKSRILTGPQEELLEDFYHSLGSPYLSSLVEEEPRIGSTAKNQYSAIKLQKLVYERSRLFVHDHPKEVIRHDPRWLEKNLRVEAVSLISLRRSLRGQSYSHVEKRTAAVTYDQGKGWTLWITAEGYDMFQVSQALVNLLLIRSKPYSTMMLEMLLSTDLLRLRARGYNVDRILRAKAEEARIAEDQRQKQVEEERKRIQEQEKTWDEERAGKPPKANPQSPLSIPGSFTESPEPERSEDGVAPTRKPKGIFSSLSKRLGLDDSSQPGRQLQNLLANNRSNAEGTKVAPLPPPPPYSPLVPQQGSQSGRKADEVTAPHQLQTNLLNAVNASRAHDSSNVYSRPSSTNVKESSTYCDERPGQDISFAAESTSGIKIFLANSLADKSSFVAAHSSALNLFANILLDCGQVFSLPRASLHIFYDEHGSTIAFNRQGSLFCNFRFFEQLHLKGLQEEQQRQGQGVTHTSEALIYWFVVLSHELAHNLVADHSAEHSYWT